MTEKRERPEAAPSISEAVALIGRAERRLLAALELLPADGPVTQFAELLQDLTMARLKLEVPDAEDNRACPRVHERSMVCIRGIGGTEAMVEAEVHDISAGGALISCDAPLTDGARYEVEVDGLAMPVTARVRAGNANFFHLVFESLTADRKLELTKHLERRYFRV